MENVQTLPDSEQPELETMSPAERTASVLPHISVENIYFDIIPEKFSRGWINEDGAFRIQPH